MVNGSGKKLVSPGKRHSRIGRFVVLRSNDPEATEWEVVIPGDVPNWLHDPDVFGEIADGQHSVRNPEDETDETWYRVESVAVHLDS